MPQCSSLHQLLPGCPPLSLPPTTQPPPPRDVYTRRASGAESVAGVRTAGTYMCPIELYTKLWFDWRSTACCIHRTYRFCPEQCFVITPIKRCAAVSLAGGRNPWFNNQSLATRCNGEQVDRPPCSEDRSLSGTCSRQTGSRSSSSRCSSCNNGGSSSSSSSSSRRSAIRPRLYHLNSTHLLVSRGRGGPM